MFLELLKLENYGSLLAKSKPYLFWAVRREPSRNPEHGHYYDADSRE